MTQARAVLQGLGAARVMLPRRQARVMKKLQQAGGIRTLEPSWRQWRPPGGGGGHGGTNAVTIT